MSTQSVIQMRKTTTKIIRNSLQKFIQHYQYFTTTPTFILLPYTITFLISQTLTPHSLPLLSTVSGRLNTVFKAAGFPNSGHFLDLVTRKLSQIISTSIVTLPFSISFLLLSKALILHHFTFTKKPSFLSFYQPLITTYLCNSLLIFAVNASCFSFFSLGLSFLQVFELETSKFLVLFFTILSTILYIIIIGHTLVICNISLVSLAFQRHENSGFLAILKTLVRIKGKNTIALALAVPIKLGTTAIEGLFYYIIVMNSHPDSKILLVAFEGVFIGYMYSIVLVVEVIMTCVFYRSCVMNDDEFRVEEEDVDGRFQGVDMGKIKVLEEFELST